MASKYSRSCIFTGHIDSLCLSCQMYVKVDDIERHVESPEHHSTLKSIAYVENYKEDLIWKVKQGYYCEICNILIATVAKVRIHLTNSIHISNKPRYLLKGCKEGVIVFDDIFIEMNAWHSLSDGSCLVCNEEYQDENTHIGDPMHVVNLIQSNMELKDKMVYRKIDDNAINCLTCNTLLNVESKASHIESSEHKTQYFKCQEDRKKITNQNNGVVNQNGCEDANNKKTSETNETSEVKEIIDTDKSAAIKNNEEYLETQESNTNNTSLVKYENETLPPMEALRQAKQFAKENHMKYKRNSTFCKVCDIRISSSLKMMKEHALEIGHKEKVKLRQTKLNNKPLPSNKKSMLDFIDSEIRVRGVFCNDIIINDEICIEAISMHMVGISYDKLRCHVCEVSFHKSQMEEHKRTYKHSNAMLVTPVLTDFNGEFIREVRSGVFHCGYCNFIEASLDGMQNHLKSENHLQKKRLCRTRLYDHMPDVMESRQRDGFLNFMRMLYS